MQSKVSALGSASEHIAGSADVDNATLPVLTDARQLIVDAAKHLQVRYLHPTPYLKWSLQWALMHGHQSLPCTCSTLQSRASQTHC